MSDAEKKSKFRFTPDVLRTIRRRAGKVPGRDLADELGCDYGSLRNVCNRHGISLRCTGDDEEPRPQRRPIFATGAPAREFCFMLPHNTRTVCEREALLRGVSLEVLTRRLIEVVAADNLWNAVLDE